MTTQFKNKKRNTIQISLASYKDLVGEKICDIKWDSRGTPLVISRRLGDSHYHHYYENGKLVAHLKNERTGERIEAEAGISKSVSEILKIIEGFK